MLTNVLEYLEMSAARFPEKTALVDENESLSFFELLSKAKSIGSFVSAATNTVKRPIPVLIGRNCASVVSFFGALYSGNFYVPIDAETPPERLEKMLETLKPIASIIAAPLPESVRNCGLLGTVLDYTEAVSHEINESALTRIRNSSIDIDPAYVMFTSGSTGLPKGAVICHRGVIELAEWLADTFSFSETDILGNQTPFYFDASVKDIYSFIRNGSTMHILPKKLFSFPALLVKHLNENKINTILWAASAVRLIANSGILAEVRPEYLRKIFFSGENMLAKHINIWRRHLPNAEYINLYGPTEITVDAAYHKLCRDYDDGESIPIGKPCRNKDIFLANRDGTPVASGETGEIYVRGSGVSFGYYNDWEKTEAAFVQNPLNNSYNELVYKTGDLARYNGYCELVFVSRADSQVKHMGNRIELGEIEAAVNALPEVEAAVCIYDADKQAIALIFQGQADKRIIVDGIKNKLPKYMYPGVFIKNSQMPLNSNGKIDRVRLKNDYFNGTPKRIESPNELNALIAPSLKKDCITNGQELPAIAGKLLEQGRLSSVLHENGVLLLADYESYYRMYYFLKSLDIPLALRAEKPVTVEMAYAGKPPSEADMVYWDNNGFARAVKRLRMSVSDAGFAPGEGTREGDIKFASVSELSAVLKILERGFDKYTGFLLPRGDMKTAASNQEILCFYDSEQSIKGVLHFGKNKQSAFLLHLAVSEDCRGKGVSKALLRKWKDEAYKKYTLWVRADNAAARALYEKSGFSYDGAEAVTLLRMEE